MVIRIKRQGDLVVLIIRDDPTRCGKRDLQVVLTKTQVDELIQTLQAA